MPSLHLRAQLWSCIESSSCLFKAILKALLCCKFYSFPLYFLLSLTERWDIIVKLSDNEIGLEMEMHKFVFALNKKEKLLVKNAHLNAIDIEMKIFCAFLLLCITTSNRWMLSIHQDFIFMSLCIFCAICDCVIFRSFLMFER